MSVELAEKCMRSKPWGVADLSPWGRNSDADTPVGEIWYERSSWGAPSLLLKLLFAAKPLSIQVHPDDVYARSIGQANGKTEAWYVLNADPGAKVALGLNETMPRQQLRQAVDDGSISERVAWQPVAAGDSMLVPAGTIHAIGAGLVIAEIQQRSDTTFRLFDHGRARELQVTDGVAAANSGPAAGRFVPDRLTVERTVLASCPHFVFERIILEPDTVWQLAAERETWLLVIGGDGLTTTFDIATGDALFVEADHVEIHAGEIGMVALVAYAGPHPMENLLQRSQTASVPLNGARPEFLPTAALQGPSANGRTAAWDV